LKLLGLSKTGYYYQRKGESAFNLKLMRLLDEQYTQTPFYGVPKMTAWLKTQGYPVGPKRVRRLMRQIGLIAIFPKPKTSLPGGSKETYPYLLRSVVISRPNQVWSTDLTYIRLSRG
jgi:putative transposase